ncbi:MAG: prolyl oligopeptidase family serine peptidase [Verrucomicrobiota bacterium]|nr:prolyl oligopeptidase family serine peptidase [Verrucomicrobiota bacterium]
MRLSPDGKWLAAIAPREGKNNLFTIRLSDRKLFGCTEEDEEEVYSFTWISNERLVFEMKNRNNFPNGGLYAVNRDGSKPKVLNLSFMKNREFGARVMKVMNMFDPLTDHGQDILVEIRKGGGLFQEDRAFYGNIVRLNTITGKEERIAYNRGDILEFVADREKTIRIGMAQHGLVRSILHRRDANSEWEEVYSGDFRTAIAPLGFGKNPDILYVSAPNGDKKALFQFDLKKKKLGRMIFAHPTYDVPAGPPIVSDKTDKVIGVRYEAERSQVYWFNKDYQQYQAMIDKSLPSMANDIKNWSRSEDLILFHSHSEKTIGSYYLLDISNKKKPKMEKLLDLAGWIDPQKMSPMKSIKYTARDGLVIHAFLTIPNGSDGKNLPLIVHPHGGPSARDYWGWNADVQFLANRGYAVFQPNFRGSTGYGTKLLTSGYREWGGAMQNDITDGVKHLIDEGIVDPKRVGIYGASYGGYATMAGLCFTPELYRCGINYVGVTDIDLILKEYPLPKKINDAIDAVMIADRKKDKDWIKRRSIQNNIDKVRAPVLMAYGMKDWRVPPKHGRILKRALDKNDVPNKLIIKANEGHGYRNEKNVFEFYREVDDFLEQHMK